MTDYIKTTDFEAKDLLPSGDANKVVKGADFEAEFDNIVTAIASKVDKGSSTCDPVCVLDFGAVGDWNEATGTDNTLAIQAAIDSLAGVGGSVYIPAGKYKITSTLDLTDTMGITFYGDASEASHIVQVTDTQSVIQVSGNFMCVEKITLRHSPSVLYDKTSAIALHLVDTTSHSSFRDIRTGGSAYGIKLNTRDTSSAAVFSCSFDNLYLFGYSRVGVELIAVNSGSTGNSFNNIYINALKGTPAVSGNVECGFYASSLTESSFTQLNIENAQLPNAIVAYGGETLTFNSVHFEGLTPRAGPAGTTANFSGYIRSSNKVLVMNGLSLINSFYDDTYVANYSIFHSITGSQLQLNGFVTRANTLTGTVTAGLYVADAVANKGYMYANNLKNSDGAGVTDFNIEDNLFIDWLPNTAYIDAADMTADAATPVLGTAAARQVCWNFANGLDTFLHGALPEVVKSWNRFRVYAMCTQAGTTTGAVVMVFVYEPYDVAATLNASGTSSSVTFTASGTANLLSEANLTTAGVITVIDKDIQTFRFRRVGADAADTFAADYKILGLQFRRVS